MPHGYVFYRPNNKKPQWGSPQTYWLTYVADIPSSFFRDGDPTASRIPTRTAAIPQASRSVTASRNTTALKMTPKRGTVKLKNVNSPEIIQIKDEPITHL